MKNVVDEKPTRDLRGSLAWSRSFVEVDDCVERDILDIGCGFGWFELLALDRGAKSITGVEPTEADLSTARKHLEHENVRFAVASALELPSRVGCETDAAGPDSDGDDPHLTGANEGHEVPPPLPGQLSVFDLTAGRDGLAGR